MSRFIILPCLTNQLQMSSSSESEWTFVPDVMNFPDTSCTAFTRKGRCKVRPTLTSKPNQFILESKLMFVANLENLQGAPEILHSQGRSKNTVPAAGAPQSLIMLETLQVDAETLCQEIKMLSVNTASLTSHIYKLLGKEGRFRKRSWYVSQLLDHFGPDWNGSTTLRLTAVKFCPDVHGSLTGGCPDFTFSATLRLTFMMKCLDTSWLDWH